MVDVVRHLCELPQGEPGAVTQWMKNAAMELAAQNGHSTVVRYLCELPLDRGVDPSLANNKAIESAASIGHVDVVRYLCELPPDRGVDPSAHNSRSVQWAAYNGHMDVVRYLCELPQNRGVDPSARNNDAIRVAASNGHLGTVRYLCELPRHRGVDPVRAVRFPYGMLASHADRTRTFVDLVRYLCELPLPQAVHLQVVAAACKHSSAFGEAGYIYKTADRATLNAWKELWGNRSPFGRMSARQPLLVLRAVVRGMRAG